jgi:hypothetical protein
LVQVDPHSILPSLIGRLIDGRDVTGLARVVSPSHIERKGVIGFREITLSSYKGGGVVGSSVNLVKPDRRRAWVISSTGFWKDTIAPSGLATLTAGGSVGRQDFLIPRARNQLLRSSAGSVSIYVCVCGFGILWLFSDSIVTGSRGSDKNMPALLIRDGDQISHGLPLALEKFIALLDFEFPIRFIQVIPSRCRARKRVSMRCIESAGQELSASIQITAPRDSIGKVPSKADASPI